VLDIMKKARSLNLDVQPIWVSRDNPFLQKADAISKGVDTDSWVIGEGDFSHLCGLFDPFSVDLSSFSKSSHPISFSHPC
jgi:hypothetical protein